MILPPIKTQIDVNAVRAVLKGEANPEQQIRAMEWIVGQACRRFDSVYEPSGDPRDNAFEQGRQFVGIEILNMTSPITEQAAIRYDQAIAAGKRPTRGTKK